MKLRFLKAKHWLLLTLLGWMGVAVSCTEKYGCPEDGPDMYGCPPSEYNDSIVKL
ncbi:MAG: hypothetical protein IKM79_06965 [Bacteroidales bacterium]|nr:hypothetical protein [Bacteroidales bacterium]